MAEKHRKSRLNAGNGNLDRSSIIVSNNNSISKNVNIAPLFETIYHFVDVHPKLQSGKKQDAKKQLKEIQTALEEQKPDEDFLARRFRNLKRMAPDIAEAAFETLKNPASGVVEVVRRIAKKVTGEANT